MSSSPTRDAQEPILAFLFSHGDCFMVWYYIESGHTVWCVCECCNVVAHHNIIYCGDCVDPCTWCVGRITCGNMAFEKGIEICVVVTYNVQ